ncbi:MAG: hypothetical protein AMS24_03205 [Chlamydiae bacterium SM23_39]|nr:MAG: hypothetical protein AMS24_03205 [Chlamydiae bacterium SM23_39]
MKKTIFIFFILFSTFLKSEDISWKKYKKKTFFYQKKIPGWCTVEKSEKMMNLIYNASPEICVEIGVFGGSSVYPTAMALKFLNKGKIYAIDPWENNECVEGYDKNDPNYIWWNKINLNKIYKSFKKMININKLSSFCQIMKMTSENAVNFFKDESIDILHIDGNHTEQKSFLDVQNFLPKVKKGGFIWFDDANWNTTSKAINYLQENCEFLPNMSINNTCLLFRKF